VRWYQNRDEGKELLGGIVGVGAISFFSGGWWWFRNLVVYSDIQPFGRVGRVAAEAGFQASFIEWQSLFLPKVFRGFWGSFVWPEGEWGVWRLPLVATVALLLLVILGTIASRHRAAMVVVLLPVPLIWVTVITKSWDVYLYEGLIKGAQGRYAYSGLAAISVAFGIGLWKALGYIRVSYLAVAVAAVLAVLLEVRMFTRQLWRFWGPKRGGPLSESYAGFVAWSPLPPILTHTIVVLFFVGCVALIVGAMNESITEKRQRHADAQVALDT
jgi:hypothetical protein